MRPDFHEFLSVSNSLISEEFSYPSTHIQDVASDQEVTYLRHISLHVMHDTSHAWEQPPEISSGGKFAVVFQVAPPRNDSVHDARMG